MGQPPGVEDETPFSCQEFWTIFGLARRTVVLKSPPSFTARSASGHFPLAERVDAMARVIGLWGRFAPLYPQNQ